MQRNKNTSNTNAATARPVRTIVHSTGKRRRQKRKNQYRPILLVAAVIGLYGLWLGTNRTLLAAHRTTPTATAGAEPERVVEFLLTLARLPAEKLRPMIEGSEESDNKNIDPFHLAALQNGQCPFSSSSDIEWLPARPVMSRTASERFKARSQLNGIIDGKTHPQNKDQDPVDVLVYYEHLSKAGGTSFCKLAQSNLPRKQVPKYYCMPSKPGMPDARVGSWTPDELLQYLSSGNQHRLVSNEWEPFNHAFLEGFQPTTTTTTAKKEQQQDGGGKSTQQLMLLFVTSIRHPVNRLLSAYKFWGQLHNPAPKDRQPTLEVWLQRQAGRADRFKIKGGDFLANVGRFNFATWKFSGGKLAVGERLKHAEAYLTAKPEDLKKTNEEDKESHWKDPFVTAVRTLIRFDLAIPMEQLSQYPSPLTELLGWTDFTQIHVVPSGTVVNNAAKSELSKETYGRLWEANKLDMVLYYWTTAVYLSRLHCPSLFQQQ